MTAVHQLIPVLAGADAIGHHTLRAREALRAAGFESDVFAEVVHDDVAGEARPVAHLDRLGRRARPDLLVYQCSTGTGLTDLLLARPEPLVVDYHNITPASFFERWEPEAALSMRRARTDLRRLAARTALALADSSFNAADLEAEGFSPVEVVPPLVDLRRAPPDPATAAVLRRRRRGPHWLFVGRLAPNKCQHDLVAALAVARRLHDPGTTLTLVGGTTSELYRDAVESLADELGVAGAVTIAGRLSPAELAAHWDDADVFVCLSEHEGFCVPLLEAMHAGVPVVAYAAAAVPETVGPAGVLLDDKDPVLVATAVHRLLADDPARARLVALGRERAASFAPDVTGARLVDAVRRLLAAGDARG